MMEDFCFYKDGKTYLYIKVTPKASKNAIMGVRDEKLLISVTAVPEKNQANEAVIKILSKELKIAKSKMQIASGSKGKNKMVCIDEDAMEKIISAFPKGTEN